MDPSELKKLRNKQRKAKKKAELEKLSQQQAQAKKEMHNKANSKKNDEELDSPAKDELVPEKLARVEDPLGEALKFLQPLQQLASACIVTHILAFEIYFRKGNHSYSVNLEKQFIDNNCVMVIFQPNRFSCCKASNGQ